MGIVTFSDALIQKLSAGNGRILRDRILCGFCLRVGARTRTFLVATSVGGQQFRMTIGRWPCLSVEQARMQAAAILHECRLGRLPAKRRRQQYPTVIEAIEDYCRAKKLKASSRTRYLSIVRTHFSEWQSSSVQELGSSAFAEHCHRFSQSAGAALVELARGLFGALMKYVNATCALSLESPFARLAAAGVMPDRAKPRARRLQEADLPQWKMAVDVLPEKARDYLYLLALTGVRRNECASLLPEHVDLRRGILHFPDTKTGHPHSLPITPIVDEILRRRLSASAPGERLFAGVSVEHVAEMAQRAGAPRFMLHDLRKLLATIGEKLGLGDAVNRRILNHSASRSDTLHRHYVNLGPDDIRDSLERVQRHICDLMVAR